MTITGITPFIIAANAEQTIEDTLISLSNFKEVILYLNNSDDRTESIADKFANVVIHHGEFLGFGPTKNKASSFASSEWVLSIDSDEVIPRALVDELKSLDLSNERVLYYLQRDNYFLGKKIRFSGWGNDILSRLYNRNFHSVNLESVHEKIEPKLETQKVILKNSFQHNAIYNIDQQLEKILYYSNLSPKGENTRSFLLVIFKAYFTFFRAYILYFGFLDGWRGYAIAKANATGRYYIYLKKYIENSVA